APCQSDDIAIRSEGATQVRCGSRVDSPQPPQVGKRQRGDRGAAQLQLPLPRPANLIKQGAGPLARLQRGKSAAEVAAGRLSGNLCQMGVPQVKRGGLFGRPLGILRLLRPLKLSTQSNG